MRGIFSLYSDVLMDTSETLGKPEEISVVNPKRAG